MNINVNAVGFKTDVKLDEFIDKKVSKLESVYERIQGAEVTLRLDAKEKDSNMFDEAIGNVLQDKMKSKVKKVTFKEFADELYGIKDGKKEEKKPKAKKAAPKKAVAEPAEAPAEEAKPKAKKAPAKTKKATPKAE